MRLNLFRTAFVLFCLTLSGHAFAQGKPESTDKPRATETIAPNDLLKVQVYDAPEFTRALRVMPGGDVRMPMLKPPVHVAGLSPAQAEKAIRETLIREHLISDPFVSVTIAKP